MSDASADNLTKKKIQQLLAAVGSEPTEDTTQADYTEYDWYHPHYFNSNELRKLDAFTKKVAEAMNQKFTDLCHTDSNVTITSVTQHFADEFFNQALKNEQSDHYLSFGIDREQEPQTQDGTFDVFHPCGLIGIPPQTAITWVTQLLGDSESDKDAGKDLSQLEESLLLDIASAIVEAFSDSHGSYNFLPNKNIIRGHLPLEAQGIEEICKITFGVEKTDSENNTEAYFLIPSHRLEPVVKTTAQDVGKFSAEDISKIMLTHLEQIPVTVVAQLASTAISFNETMSLQAGDVLLLDKETGEPVELIVEGRTLFRGQPAKSTGRHAVVITEQCSSKE
jgi:flagellar motor switch protein FliM